jgi:hypothetical protein
MRCVTPAAVWSYGRGRRDTALRRARALSARPISASSAVAWTAVPKISVPAQGAVLRLALRGCAGIPAGCGGCRRRAEVWRAGRLPGADVRAADGLMAARDFRAADTLAAGRDFRAAEGRGASADFRAAAGFRAAGAFDGAAGVAGPDGRARRLSLRRCGRVRGSAPRRSVGRFSLIADQSSHGRVLRISVQVETLPAVLRKEFERNAENIPTSKNIALYSRFTGGCAPLMLPSAS